MGSQLYSQGRAQLSCDDFCLTGILNPMWSILLPLAFYSDALLITDIPDHATEQKVTPSKTFLAIQMPVSTWGSWEWISREQQGTVGKLGGHRHWLDHCHLRSPDCAFLWNLSGHHDRFVFWYGQQVFLCWRVWVCHSLHRHILRFITAADLRVLELNFQEHNTVEWGPISDLHLQDDDESKSIWGGRL